MERKKRANTFNIYRSGVSSPPPNRFFHHTHAALHQNHVSIVPKIPSTTNKNAFTFRLIPRDSKLADGGFSYISSSFSSSDLERRIFVLISAAWVEKADDVGGDEAGGPVQYRGGGALMKRGSWRGKDCGCGRVETPAMARLRVHGGWRSMVDDDDDVVV
jgi:hypothetical protein